MLRRAARRELVCCSRAVVRGSTCLVTPEGVGEVVDFMPIHFESRPKRAEEHQVVRIVRGIRGELPFRLTCDPAFDYGRERGKPSATASGCRFVSGRFCLDLATPLPLALGEHLASAEFLLREGEEMAHAEGLANSGGITLLGRNVERRVARHDEKIFVA